MSHLEDQNLKLKFQAHSVVGKLLGIILWKILYVIRRGHEWKKNQRVRCSSFLMWAINSIILPEFFLETLGEHVDKNLCNTD